MSHERKKGGQRKDKKMERMREAVEKRHREAGGEKRTTDQQDIQTFKPGSASDRTTRPETRKR